MRVFALLTACAGEPPASRMDGLHPKEVVASDTDTDTDSDTDTDTDSDTDTDADTDTDTTPVRKPAWSWGATNTVADADAAYVGFDESSYAYARIAGDLDGDGLDEIAVVWSWTTGVKVIASGPRVWALDMPAGALPEVPGVPSGLRPVFVGDVNGDGMDDVATNSPSGLVLGRSDLFAKWPAAPDVAVSGLPSGPGGSVGLNSLSKVGDMDGDGRAEWMAQSSSSGGSCALHVFSGATISSAGAELTLDDAIWSLSDAAGRCLVYVGPGDVTGDGRADIFVVPQGDSSDRLWVLEGGSELAPDASVDDAAVATFGSACGGNAQWPWSDSLPGDMNDDGTSELMAQIYDSECDDGFYIIPGGDTLSGALDTSAATTFAEHAVYRAGDVNGDGYSELYYSDPKGLGLVLGNGALPAEVTSDDVDIHGLYSTLLGDQQLPDVNGDGTGDVVWGSRVFLGRTVWPSTVTDADADATFVTAKGEPLSTGVVTDIDGDDYDDIVMGSTADQAVYIFFGQP